MHSGGQNNTASTMRTSTSLISDLREGDGAVWRRFVDHYRPAIVGFSIGRGLRADEAEDAAQRTWCSFSKAMQAGKYHRESGRLRKWLFGFARMHVLEGLRLRAREMQNPRETNGTDSSSSPVEPVDPGIPWDALWRQELFQMCLADCRTKFDAQTVEAFVGFVLEERPAREVGHQLDMTENAVYLAKRRVSARIREILEPSEHS